MNGAHTGKDIMVVERTSGDATRVKSSDAPVMTRPVRPWKVIKKGSGGQEEAGAGAKAGQDKADEDKT